MFRRALSNNLSKAAAAGITLTLPVGVGMVPTSNAAVQSRGIASVTEDEYLKIRMALQLKVQELVVAEGTFSDAYITKACADFFALQLEWTYVKTFKPEQVLQHVLGFATAKAEAAKGKPFEYALESERGGFWFCEATHESQLKTQRHIEAYALERGRGLGQSMRSYTSNAKNTVLYCLFMEEFPNGFIPKEQRGSGFKSLEELCSASFMQFRSQDSKNRYTDILKRLDGSITPVYTIREVKDGGLNIAMGFQPDRSSYLTALTTLFETIPGSRITKRFVETFSGGQQVYSFFLKGVTKADLEKVCWLIGMLPHRPENAVTKLYSDGKILPECVPFCHSLIIFAFYFTPPLETLEFAGLSGTMDDESSQLRKLKKMRQDMHQELMSENYVASVLEKHYLLINSMYDDFKADKAVDQADAHAKIGKLTNNPVEVAILKTFVRFTKSIIKTNYFKMHRAAISYRLDPKEFIGHLDYPTMPFGIFLVVGAQFRGFHVRFNDIARGGIRMIRSKGDKYRHNRKTLFQENYNLAHAQLLKNKDIPESGSKGTLLVSDRRGPNPKVMFLQYIDAILDLLLPGEVGVRDYYKQPEILFMGPDENTAGTLPSEAAYHAKGRGYKAWKSFTTGKGQDIGGVPHDIYGMTTESVRANVQAIYKQFELTETKLTKFQTGGPDGDLGSNEILLGKEIYHGVVDISGVLFDSEGINREELVRLAHGRPNLKLRDFDKSKLGPKGFFVDANDRNITLPDGTVVESGEAFRDEFHFSDLIKTDVFVPCGGRPNAVTLENVHRFLVDCPEFTGETMLYGKVGNLCAKDKTRFKYIVEGANLFITQEARLALENVGVTLVKDSSANKGGVTSSSIEVLAALSLTDTEHAEHMCVKDGKFPNFYNALVKEIIERIRYNATREYNSITVETFKKDKSHQGKRTLVADEFSRKIVKMRNNINASDMFNDDELKKHVLALYVPKLIQDLVGIESVIQRVPENYLRACFATFIASDFVYTTGLEATEFDFFQYMHALYKNSGSTK